MPTPVLHPWNFNNNHLYGLPEPPATNNDSYAVRVADLKKALLDYVDLKTAQIIGGNKTFTGQISGSSFYLKNSILNKEVIRQLPANTDSYINIGTFNIENGAIVIRISTVVSSPGFSVAKEYSVPSYFNNFTTWRKLIPVKDTGNFRGEDFGLEIRHNGNNIDLRSRRTGGNNDGELRVRLEILGSSNTTFTENFETGIEISPADSIGLIREYTNDLNRIIEILGNLNVKEKIISNEINTQITKTSGIVVSFVTKTTDYTITKTDCTVNGDATTGNITFFLPPAASLSPGQQFKTAKADPSTNTVSIQAAAGDSIIGVARRVLESQWDSIVYETDGNKTWFIY